MRHSQLAGDSCRQPATLGVVMSISVTASCCRQQISKRLVWHSQVRAQVHRSQQERAPRSILQEYSETYRPTLCTGRPGRRSLIRPCSGTAHLMPVDSVNAAALIVLASAAEQQGDLLGALVLYRCGE